MRDTHKYIITSNIISFVYFMVVVVAYILFYAFFDAISTSMVQLFGALGVLAILSIAPVIYTIVLAVKALRGNVYSQSKHFKLDQKTIDLKDELQTAFVTLIQRTKEIKNSGVLKDNTTLTNIVLEVEELAEFIQAKLSPDELTTLTVNTDLVEYLHARLKEELVLIEGLDSLLTVESETLDVNIIEETYIILRDKFNTVKVSALY